MMSAAVHGIDAGVEASLTAAGPTTFYVTHEPMEVTGCNGMLPCYDSIEVADAAVHH